MDKSMKRAIRRHHIARLKKARKNYWGYPNRWAYKFNELPRAPEPMDARQLGKVVQNPQMCSCAGCCNVRRNPWSAAGDGRTWQEKRHWHNYREGLAEVVDKEEE